jgi:uncharacterized membrane protein
METGVVHQDSLAPFINAAAAHGHFSLYATVDGLFSRSVFVMLFSRLFCFFFFLLFSFFPLQLRSTQSLKRARV